MTLTSTKISICAFSPLTLRLILVMDGNKEDCEVIPLPSLYLSDVLCAKALTYTDFVHMCTPNCQEKSNKLSELSKRMASECNITSGQYHITILLLILLTV